MPHELPLEEGPFLVLLLLHAHQVTIVISRQERLCSAATYSLNGAPPYLLILVDVELLFPHVLMDEHRVETDRLYLRIRTVLEDVDNIL